MANESSCSGCYLCGETTLCKDLVEVEIYREGFGGPYTGYICPTCDASEPLERTAFDEYFDERMQDPEFAAEYARASQEIDALDEMITDRTEKNPDFPELLEKATENRRK